MGLCQSDLLDIAADAAAVSRRVGEYEALIIHHTVVLSATFCAIRANMCTNPDEQQSDTTSRNRRFARRAVTGVPSEGRTGFEWYRHVRSRRTACLAVAAKQRRREPPPPPVPPQPTEDELDLDRENEYALDTDEPMLGRPPAGDVE